MNLARYCKQIEQVDVGWCDGITDYGVTEVSALAPTLRYLGLIRCNAITMATMTELMNKYPHVTYSTLWLDYQRLIAKANADGLLRS